MFISIVIDSDVYARSMVNNNNNQTHRFIFDELRMVLFCVFFNMIGFYHAWVVGEINEKMKRHLIEHFSKIHQNCLPTLLMPIDAEGKLVV